MKWITYLPVLAFSAVGLFLNFSYAQEHMELNADKKDTLTALAFLNAFKDPDMAIGYFEKQSQPNAIRTKAGVMPQYEKDYLKLMISQHLTKLYTLRSIKGEFDNIVFVKTNALASGPPGKAIFLPVQGSKWLLILKKTFDKNGLPLSNWAIKNEHLQSYSFINAYTLFEQSSYQYSAFCLQWPENITKPSSLSMVGENLVEDLATIESALHQSGERQQSIVSSLKSATGMAIATALFPKSPAR